jgi:hypothetical protein
VVDHPSRDQQRLLATVGDLGDDAAQHDAPRPASSMRADHKEVVPCGLGSKGGAGTGVGNQLGGCTHASALGEAHSLIQRLGGAVFAERRRFVQADTLRVVDCHEVELAVTAGEGSGLMRGQVAAATAIYTANDVAEDRPLGAFSRDPLDLAVNGGTHGDEPRHGPPTRLR